jgi:outer membrane protein assembly factor BamE
MTPFSITCCTLAAAACLSGCGSSLRSSDGTVLGWIKPYRIEIVQGNVVTKEQAAMARPGMSKAQVRDVLGSPLVMDPFHADRWDYVFTIRRPGTAPQQRRIVALFDGEQLKSIEAPDLPTEREFVDSIDILKPTGRVPTLALTEQQINALPVPRPVAPAASAPEGAARTYPPLEPASR